MSTTESNPKFPVNSIANIVAKASSAAAFQSNSNPKPSCNDINNSTVPNIPNSSGKVEMNQVSNNTAASATIIAPSKSNGKSDEGQSINQTKSNIQNPSTSDKILDQQTITSEEIQNPTNIKSVESTKKPKHRLSASASAWYPPGCTPTVATGEMLLSTARAKLVSPTTKTSSIQIKQKPNIVLTSKQNEVNDQSKKPSEVLNNMIKPKDSNNQKQAFATTNSVPIVIDVQPTNKVDELIQPNKSTIISNEDKQNSHSDETMKTSNFVQVQSSLIEEKIKINGNNVIINDNYQTPKNTSGTASVTKIRPTPVSRSSRKSNSQQASKLGHNNSRQKQGAYKNKINRKEAFANNKLYQSVPATTSDSINQPNGNHVEVTPTIQGNVLISPTDSVQNIIISTSTEDDVEQVLPISKQEEQVRSRIVPSLQSTSPVSPATSPPVTCPISPSPQIMEHIPKKINNQMTAQSKDPAQDNITTDPNISRSSPNECKHNVVNQNNVKKTVSSDQTKKSVSSLTPLTLSATLADMANMSCKPKDLDVKETSKDEAEIPIRTASEHIPPTTDFHIGDFQLSPTIGRVLLYVMAFILFALLAPVVCAILLIIAVVGSCCFAILSAWVTVVAFITTVALLPVTGIAFISATGACVAFATFIITVVSVVILRQFNRYLASIGWRFPQYIEEVIAGAWNICYTITRSMRDTHFSVTSS